MKTGLLGILLSIMVIIFTCGAPIAASAVNSDITSESTHNILKGGISGSCGNIGVGPAGILILLAAWVAGREKKQ